MSSSAMILTILLAFFVHLYRSSSGLSNLFNYSGSNNADTIYGWTCLTYTDYVPTCGWQLILYSSHPLTGMAGGAEFYTYTQVDSYTFHLNAVSKYADLTNMRPNCPDIQVIGSFGSSIPSLTVNWYCVCNQTTNSICLAVAGTALDTASTTATSTSQTASHISSGLSNLFNYSSSNNADTIYGWTCLTYTDYVPTCGWKLILYSSHPLTGMAGGAEFYTYTPVDSYTFHLNAVSKYADLTNMRPNCPDIQVIGNFRSIIPSLTVNWFCVCDKTTNGLCQPVVGTIPEASTTSTASITTSTTATTASSLQTASYTSSGMTNLFNYSSSNNADTIYGWTCLTYTDYVPTCGWKLILYSSHPLTGMAGGAEFYTYTQVDSYTFHLNAVSKYADLTNMRPNCPDIQVIGNFKTIIPNLTVNWYCVCNQTTNSICQTIARGAAKSTETSSTTYTITGVQKVGAVAEVSYASSDQTSLAEAPVSDLTYDYAGSQGGSDVVVETPSTLETSTTSTTEPTSSTSATEPTTTTQPTTSTSTTQPTTTTTLTTQTTTSTSTTSSTSTTQPTTTSTSTTQPTTTTTSTTQTTTSTSTTQPTTSTSTTSSISTTQPTTTSSSTTQPTTTTTSTTQTTTSTSTTQPTTSTSTTSSISTTQPTTTFTSTTQPTTTSTSTTQPTSTSTSTTQPTTTSTSTTQPTTTSTTTTQPTTSSTSTTPLTTATTSTSTTTTTSALSASSSTYVLPSSMKSALLTEIVNSCQTNSLATVVLWRPDLFTCAIQCLSFVNCTGVNYWAKTQRCDIVYVTTTTSTSSSGTSGSGSSSSGTSGTSGSGTSGSGTSGSGTSGSGTSGSNSGSSGTSGSSSTSLSGCRFYIIDRL